MQIGDITSNNDARITTPLDEYKNLLKEMHPWVELKIRGESTPEPQQVEDTAGNSLLDKINNLKRIYGNQQT